MKITNYPAALNDILSEYGIQADYYFDRLRIAVDHHTPKKSLEQLGLIALTNTEDLVPSELTANNHLNRILDVRQPPLELLRRLHDVIGDHALLKVERAYDFSSDDPDMVSKLDELFNRYWVYPQRVKKQDHFYFYQDGKCTVRMTPDNANTVLLMYSDKLARMSGQKTYCLHLEHRVIGLDTVKSNGLITLTDLLNFDPEPFWHSLLNFKKCNQTKLGHLIAAKNNPGQKERSRKTAHKHGSTAVKKMDSLQRYLSLNPDYAAALTNVDSVETLRVMIEKALS